jgi:ring-1,2-phenylacetyl-CoA epoxidase subunit PaaB
VNSLDPRVKRLPKVGQPGENIPKAPLDQFATFEVFVQPQTGKPFQHEGVVHAPNLEMAFVFAKETFTRRFTCASLCVADTRNVYVSPMSEGTVSAYDLIPEAGSEPNGDDTYEIYHLLKRGKQHLHAGTVSAANHRHAMSVAKREFGEKLVFNIWAIRQTDIRFTTDSEQDLWLTLPEKKFRDAVEYKGGDKLKTFVESRRS